MRVSSHCVTLSDKKKEVEVTFGTQKQKKEANKLLRKQSVKVSFKPREKWAK